MNMRYLLNRRCKFGAAVLCAAALLSVGCGGDDDNSKDYKLTVKFEPAGSGRADLAPAKYKNGDKVTVTAIPEDGKYTFVEWTGAATGTANPVTVVIDKDKTLTAKFFERFAVTTTADPVEGGIIERTPDSAYYALDSEVKLSALVNPCYKFIGWEGDTALAANRTSFTRGVTRDLTFTAKFQQLPRVEIGVSGDGSVSIDPERACYDKGDKVTLTAAANTGYEFAGWLDAKGELLNSNNPYVITIDDFGVKLTAKFNPL
jgi:uncharacterized repeat protein (TIGR02543 family)